MEELRQHVASPGSGIILENFLSGKKGTVTVMPPSNEHADYWALPIVVRFNHVDGIAPSNGVVAGTKNSRAFWPEEMDKDSACARVMQDCEEVARLLRVKVPIRIDVRKQREMHLTLSLHFLK